MSFPQMPTGTSPQSLASLSDYFTFDNVVFHHVPNALAPKLLACMLLFCFCAGVIFQEICGNFLYDLALIQRPGWREPVKALNRLAYFLCRYGALVFFIFSVAFMNVPGQSCESTAIASNVLWVLPWIFVDLIFVQRTLAVYGWNKNVAVPVIVMYLIYVGSCTYGVVKFGYGYTIPDSKFCGYQVFPTSTQPHAALFLIFIGVVLVLDTSLLLLTTHRLMEGGLGNLPHLLVTKSAVLRRDRAALKAAGHKVGEMSLSGLIIRQGIGYYSVLGVSRVAFLILYYAFSETGMYQILVCGILVTIGPLMAGMLFRQTSEAVKRTALANSSVGSARGDEAPISQIRSFRSSMMTNTPISISTAISSKTPLAHEDHALTMPIGGPLSSIACSEKEEEIEDGYCFQPTGGHMPAVATLTAHQPSALQLHLNDQDSNSPEEQPSQGDSHRPIAAAQRVQAFIEAANTQKNKYSRSPRKRPSALMSTSQSYQMTEVKRSVEDIEPMAITAASSNASQSGDYQERSETMTQSASARKFDRNDNIV